ADTRRLRRGDAHPPRGDRARRPLRRILFSLSGGCGSFPAGAASRHEGRAGAARNRLASLQVGARPVQDHAPVEKRAQDPRPIQLLGAHLLASTVTETPADFPARCASLYTLTHSFGSPSKTILPRSMSMARFACSQTESRSCVTST